MITTVRQTLANRPQWMWAIVAIALMGAAFLGYKASVQGLVVFAGLVGVVILLRQPLLGLILLPFTALVGRVDIGTGTEVNINPATVLVPVLLLIWLIDSLIHQEVRLAPSRVNRPLLLFLVGGFLSLIIGNATWDPSVPRSDRFIFVQLAQLAIFVFSGGLFLLVGNRITNVAWLRRITAAFLIVCGIAAWIRVLPGGSAITASLATDAIERAPFWLLLSSLAGGQLLFNKTLSNRWRIFLALVCVAILLYAFTGEQQERLSNWAGVAATLGIMLWLRLPRLRPIVFIVLFILIVSGVLFQFVYNYAGGDAKWAESGASRGVLIERVIEVSMRNPVTGIGPAAYRAYGFIQPLYYAGAFWVEPRLNSHNNYVDLFSQVGIVGLALFMWFMGELALTGWRLRHAFHDNFAAGFLNGMLGAWVGVIVIMALADWFLPFVYNIGFPGFQASILIWMFLGGIITLEQIARHKTASHEAAQ